MKCEVCGIEFESKRADAKYCSPKCRKEMSRINSVTDNVTLNVTLNAPDVTDNLYFEFYTETTERDTKLGKVPGDKSPTRKAKYWYNVPIAALPVIKKDWPKMPDYMNGRQYFLWWKNEFKTQNDSPVIHNPFKAGV